MKWLLQFLVGNVTKPLTEAYRAKLEASNDSDRIAAEVEIQRLESIREVRLASAGQWEMRLIVFVAGFFPAAHFAAVCIDSMFDLKGWTVHALPPPMDEWQGSIILSLFGLSALKTGIGLFSRRR